MSAEVAEDSSPNCNQVSSTTEIGSRDTSRKRKAPSELIGEEIGSGSRRTKYGRRTGLKQTRHNPSGGVDKANDTGQSFAVRELYL